MDYIIDPYWFYWIHVADRLRSALLAVSAVLGIGILTWVIVEIGTAFEWGDAEYYKHEIATRNKTRKFVIFALAPFLASVVGLIFIPSKAVLYEMMIAKFATHENAEWTLDALKSAVDYIVNAISQIGG